MGDEHVSEFRRWFPETTPMKCLYGCDLPAGCDFSHTDCEHCHEERLKALVALRSGRATILKGVIIEIQDTDLQQRGGLPSDAEDATPS